MNIDELNNKINATKSVIKAFSVEENIKYKDSAKKFFESVSSIEKDLNSAKEIINQVENLRTSLTKKLMMKENNIDAIIKSITGNK